MANGDSFRATNCLPQVKGFNRSNLVGLWGKLENDVLATAKTKRCVRVLRAGVCFNRSRFPRS